MAVATEKKVTSRELSEALKEAGAVQESERVWWDDGTFPVSVSKRHAHIKPETHVAAAFDCAELLERLDSDSHTVVVRSTKSGKFARLDWHNYPWFTDNILAEALGKLYLWCLENGHCDER